MTRKFMLGKNELKCQLKVQVVVMFPYPILTRVLAIVYIMNYTRPDIVYFVSKWSRYTSNLGEDHQKAILRVLRYLRYILNYGWHDTRYPTVLEGYNDAN